MWTSNPFSVIIEKMEVKIELKKIRYPKLTMTTPAGTTGRLVTNGYGNFWIEVESPHDEVPPPLLVALSAAGWTFDHAIKRKLKTRTLWAARHEISDKLDDDKINRLIDKAKRDLKRLGLTNIQQVDRGI